MLSFPRQKSTRCHLSMQGLCPPQPRAAAHSQPNSSHSCTWSREQQPQQDPNQPTLAQQIQKGGSSSPCPSNNLWTLCLKAIGALVNIQESVDPLIVHYISFASMTHPHEWEPAECTALLGSLEVKPLAAMGHWLSIVTHFPFILAHEPLDLFLHSMET